MLNESRTSSLWVSLSWTYVSSDISYSLKWTFLFLYLKAARRSLMKLTPHSEEEFVKESLVVVVWCRFVLKIHLIGSY